MNLSNLLHDIRHTSKRLAHPSSNAYSATLQTPAPKPYGGDMASVLTASPFQNQPPVFTQSPQPPPSPPVEDPNSKCTLPSIQSLIGMAASNHEQQAAEMERQSTQAQHPGDGPQLADHRLQAYGQPTASNSIALPPSPPLRSDFGFDGSNQSPSATSSHSSSAIIPFFGSALNENEPLQQRHAPKLSSHIGNPLPPQSVQSAYQALHYPTSPGAMSNYSYTSPANPSGTYYQRSLPSNFPPPSVTNTLASTLSNPHEQSPIDHNNPWQHHHYISPSSSAAFAGQSQDRYVCQTCNKAFSRPSSLRIHSHSHTGEKPFKCPHSGCGKAFSVRSNMKRHERGCHGGGSPGSS